MRCENPRGKAAILKAMGGSGFLPAANRTHSCSNHRQTISPGCRLPVSRADQSHVTAAWTITGKRTPLAASHCFQYGCLLATKSQEPQLEFLPLNTGRVWMHPNAHCEALTVCSDIGVRRSSILQQKWSVPLRSFAVHYNERKPFVFHSGISLVWKISGAEEWHAGNLLCTKQRKGFPAADTEAWTT